VYPNVGSRCENFGHCGRPVSLAVSCGAIPSSEYDRLPEPFANRPQAWYVCTATITPQGAEEPSHYDVGMISRSGCRWYGDHWMGNGAYSNLREEGPPLSPRGYALFCGARRRR
jgi:hypothetical protein